MLLLAALGATIIGFVLLIVALMTANLWLAVACVVVSVVGVALLLGDVLTYRRGDRDSKLAGREAKRASEKPWTPGEVSSAEDEDGSDSGGERTGRRRAAGLAGGLGGGAALAGAAAGGRSGDDDDDRDSAAREARAAGDADAAREAATVGHEEFGHHENPAENQAESPFEDGDPATGRIPLGSQGQDWSHESPADTDQPDADERATGLIFPGRYDPDMTDQIPQIEIERAWGAEWEPPEDPDKK